MDTLSISSLKARDLPRTLLRAPSPLLEFHTVPAAPPHTVLPPPSQNTTSPSWHQTIAHKLPPHDTTVGFIIRDKAYPHPPLAHLTISPRRALTQGWFPLLSADNHPAGHLFASLFSPTRCAFKPVQQAPEFPRLPHTPNSDGEKRAVSPEPGRLFRRGRMRFAITADGVPVTALPELKLSMRDQIVNGGELQTKALPKTTSSFSHHHHNTQLTEPKQFATNVVENVLRTGLRKGKKLQPDGMASAHHAGKALLKGASSIRKHLVEGDKEKSVSYEQQQLGTADTDNSHPDGQICDDDNDLSSSQLKSGEDCLDEASLEQSEDPETKPMTRFSFRKHGVSRTTQPEKANAELPERKRRRSVDFGTFEVALFHNVTPSEISIFVQDGSSHLPEALTKLTEQIIELPDIDRLECTCGKQCNTHLLTFQMSDRGPESTKIVLRITAEITTWTPTATDTVVTPRFRELMSTADDMADTFKDKFPEAEKLTYLLVGGLFTKHYPTYFENNIQYLQERLRLPRVQTVPIHTEGSIARNAKIIRDSILKTCRGSKSVVLVGHSKGGLDAVSILDSFPETVRFVCGIITFQAPFGGTFLVDFVARSKLAVSAISSVIESIWKGDQESLLDMAYAARAKSLKLRELSSEGCSGPSSNDEKRTSEPGIPVEQTVTPMEERPFQPESGEALDKIAVYREVPIVAFGSFASFDVLSIRSAANAAGVASMSPAAQKIVKNTGFLCDGLVIANDARIPYSDAILLDDMMHTEPALYIQGTCYPAGRLTACALALLFEKLARSKQS